MKTKFFACGSERRYDGASFAGEDKEEGFSSPLKKRLAGFGSAFFGNALYETRAVEPLHERVVD